MNGMIMADFWTIKVQFVEQNGFNNPFSKYANRKRGEQASANTLLWTLKHPERSEPLGFGHLRVFLIFPFIYAAFRAFTLSTGIGQVKGKHSKTEREMKKLYDLNLFVRFVWRVNTHVHCNNRVLSAEVSGICYEHEDDQRCRNPYKHPVPF